MNTKRKVVVSYENLPEDVIEAIRRKYPSGYMNYVFKVTTSKNNFFHAITVDTEDTSYLVKVKVKLDKVEKLEEELFNNIHDKLPEETDDSDVQDEPLKDE